MKGAIAGFDKEREGEGEEKGIPGVAPEAEEEDHRRRGRL